MALASTMTSLSTGPLLMPPSRASRLTAPSTPAQEVPASKICSDPGMPGPLTVATGYGATVGGHWPPCARFPRPLAVIGPAQVPGNLRSTGSGSCRQVVGTRQGHRRHVRLLQARQSLTGESSSAPARRAWQTLDACHLRQGGIAAPLSHHHVADVDPQSPTPSRGERSRPRQVVAIGWRQTIDDEGTYLGTKGETTSNQRAGAPNGTGTGRP